MRSYCLYLSSFHCKIYEVYRSLGLFLKIYEKNSLNKKVFNLKKRIAL